MITKIAYTAILVFIFFSPNNIMSQAKVHTGSEVVHEDSISIHLFNKVSLGGWYSFLKDRGRNNDPNNVFTVQDSVLRISGEEWGCITTEKEYDNYHLLVEFKWGKVAWDPRLKNARDSGILLHSTGEDGAFGGSWMYSIECQMIEGGTGDILVVGDGSDQFSITSNVIHKKDGQPYFAEKGEPLSINAGRINWWGRDTLWQDCIDFRGKDDVENKPGKWNRLECIVQGESITIVLNGIVVNKAAQVKPQSGRIQIQSEGAELFVRRIDLTPLDEEVIVNNNTKVNNTLTEQEKADGWQLLFDGKTTNGWHKFNEEGLKDGWIVENEELVCLSKGGDIVTDKEFTNFDFKIEWKISHGGNSGIFYHGKEGEEYSAIYCTSPEYQLIDDIGFPHKLNEWQRTGANYAMHNADKSKKKLKMVGEWNSSRIVVKDSLVEHYLNGEKIVQFKCWTDDWNKRKAKGMWNKYPKHGTMKTGKMGLQDHGNKIWFRNIKIKSLN